LRDKIKKKTIKNKFKTKQVAIKRMKIKFVKKKLMDEIELIRKRIKKK
jgi:hypothetical protein